MSDLASHEREARVENMEAEPINLDWKVKLVTDFQHIRDMTWEKGGVNEEQGWESLELVGGLQMDIKLLSYCRKTPN